MQMLLYIVGYSLLYFIMTTFIYFYSIDSGYNGLGLPIFGGGDDGQFYYEQAINYKNDVPYVFTSIHIWVLGFLLKIFNTENIMLLRFFNYFGNMFLLIIALLILKKITLRKEVFNISSTLLVILLAFYPSLLLNSTLSIYRDVWIYALFLWSIYLFINIFISKGRWPKIISVILLIFSMLLLGGYRKYALLSFFIGSSVYLVVKLLNKKKISLFKVSVIIILGISVFYLLFRNFRFPIVGLSFAEVLQYRQLGLEAGGSQMGISLDHSNIFLFYMNYIYSLVSNIIGPLPWQITGGATLILMITEGLLFFFISIYLISKKKIFSNLELFLIIQAMVWFLLISISNDNFGTASRLRIVGWLPLIILFTKYYGERIYNKRFKKNEKSRNQ